MNLTKKILVMMFAVSMFVFSSCEKDDSAANEALRVENLLFSKQWNFEKAVGVDGTPDAIVAEVLAGSYYNFKNDGTLTLFKNNLSQPGTWSLSSDGKTLTITSNNTTIVWTVVYISSSNMTWQYATGTSTNQIQYFYN
jgi:hypothetical protein